MKMKKRFSLVLTIIFLLLMFGNFSSVPFRSGVQKAEASPDTIYFRERWDGEFLLEDSSYLSPSEGFQYGKFTECFAKAYGNLTTSHELDVTTFEPITGTDSLRFFLNWSEPNTQVFTWQALANSPDTTNDTLTTFFMNFKFKLNEVDRTTGLATIGKTPGFGTQLVLQITSDRYLRTRGRLGNNTVVIKTNSTQLDIGSVQTVDLVSHYNDGSGYWKTYLNGTECADLTTTGINTTKYEQRSFWLGQYPSGGTQSGVFNATIDDFFVSDYLIGTDDPDTSTHYLKLEARDLDENLLNQTFLVGNHDQGYTDNSTIEMELPAQTIPIIGTNITDGSLSFNHFKVDAVEIDAIMPVTGWNASFNAYGIQLNYTGNRGTDYGGGDFERPLGSMTGNITVTAYYGESEEEAGANFFDCGFESGSIYTDDVDAWTGTEDNSEGETLEYSSSFAHHGVNSSKVVRPSTTGVTYAYAYYTLNSTASTEVFFRSYIYYTALPTHSGGFETAIYSSGGLPSGSYWNVLLGGGFWNDSGTTKYYFRWYNETANYEENTNFSVNLGQWYAIELHYNVSASTGAVEVWIDDALQFGYYGMDTDFSSKTTKYLISGSYNGEWYDTATSYTDCVAMSNSTKIGLETESNTAPSIAEFEAESTVYANKYTFVNCTIQDVDAVTELNNTIFNLEYSIQFKWLNETDTFSEESDPSGYATLDAGNCISASVNATSIKLSFKVKFTWSYPEETINIETSYVYDNEDFGSGSDVDAFTFEPDLIIHSDADVDDGRVNPSDSVTFTGTLYYQGTSTTPEDITGITAYVELSAVEKGNDATVTAGSYSIDVTAEASIDQHGYNIFSVTSHGNSVTNQTVNVIVDRLIVTISADDETPELDITVNFTCTSIYDYDDSAVTNWTINIDRNDTHFASNNFTDVQSGEITYTYTTENVSESDFGLITSTGGSVSVTWSTAEVTIEINMTSVVDGRINTDASATVRFFSRFSTNQSACTTGTLYINSSGYAINGTGWATVDDVSESTVGIWNFTVTGVNVNDETDFDQSALDPQVVWDRIIILTLDTTDSRLDLNTNSTIYATAELEYDSHALDSGSDSLEISSLSLVWDAGDSRFEGLHEESAVTSVTYSVFSSGLEATYGITSGNIDAKTVSVIWDKLSVAMSANTTTPEVNATAVVSWTITRQFDSSSVSSFNITIDRDGSPYATDLTNSSINEMYQTEISYIYDASAVSDDTYGLSGFSSTSITVTWIITPDEDPTGASGHYVLIVITTYHDIPAPANVTVLGYETRMSDSVGHAYFSLPYGEYTVQAIYMESQVQEKNINLNRGRQIAFNFEGSPNVAEIPEFNPLIILSAVFVVGVLIFMYGSSKSKIRKRRW